MAIIAMGWVITLGLIAIEVLKVSYLVRPDSALVG